MDELAAAGRAVPHGLGSRLATAPCRACASLRGERRSPARAELAAVPSLDGPSLQGHDRLFTRPRAHAWCTLG